MREKNLFILFFHFTCCGFVVHLMIVFGFSFLLCWKNIDFICDAITDENQRLTCFWSHAITFENSSFHIMNVGVAWPYVRHAVTHWRWNRKWPFPVVSKTRLIWVPLLSLHIYTPSQTTTRVVESTGVVHSWEFKWMIFAVSQCGKIKHNVKYFSFGKGQSFFLLALSTGCPTWSLPTTQHFFNVVVFSHRHMAFDLRKKTVYTLVTAHVDWCFNSNVIPFYTHPNE